MFTLNSCVRSLAPRTLKPDIGFVLFILILYHIASLTRFVMKPYHDYCQLKVLWFQFEHIRKQSWLGVIEDSFLSWISNIKGVVKHSHSWKYTGLQESIISMKVTATCNVLNHSHNYSATHVASVLDYRPVLSSICQWTDLSRYQPIWHHKLANLESYYTMATIEDFQVMLLQLPWANTIPLWNRAFKLIRHISMIICLQSSHSQPLRCTTSIIC